jgi:hypothetical protein
MALDTFWAIFSQTHLVTLRQILDEKRQFSLPFDSGKIPD